MFKDLWNRWGYVEAVKSLSWDDNARAAPIPSPKDLAAAFDLFPHRREVPFIFARVSRLLAFDDQTLAFNEYAAAVLEAIDVQSVVRRYHDVGSLRDAQGAIDPILFVARLMVEASRTGKSSREDALRLIRECRMNDPIGKVFMLIYEGAAISRLPTSDSEREPRLRSIRDETEALLNSLRSAVQASQRVQIVTNHAFQELLDNYAQYHIELANLGSPAGTREEVRKIYVRILTLRKQTTSVSDVPWLESPGKLSLYQFFKHEVGRTSDITRDVVAMYDTVPGLRDTLRKSVLEAEAFKSFRDLDTWEQGTPLSSDFAGSGMHHKLVEWLKGGW